MAVMWLVQIAQFRRLNKLMRETMDIATIIRAAIPDATDKDCEWILWERTPYPVGVITAQSVYKAASRIQRATARKKQLCEFCDRLAEQDKFTCHICDDAISRASLRISSDQALPGK